MRRTFATKVDAATRPIGKASKRRRRLVIAGGGIAIGAVAVTINDDAKHAYVAAQRSYRVVTTLVLNIKEYVEASSCWWTRVLINRYVQLPRDVEAGL